MHPSIRVLSARAHQPLIKFVGKRTYPSGTVAPHAHPAAPAELKEKFSDFVKKFEASTSSPRTKPVKAADKEAISDFWNAPERFWRPRTRVIEDSEIDAIESGGASLH